MYWRTGKHEGWGLRVKGRVGFCKQVKMLKGEHHCHLDRFVRVSVRLEVDEARAELGCDENRGMLLIMEKYPWHARVGGGDVQRPPTAPTPEAWIPAGVMSWLLYTLNTVHSVYLRPLSCSSVLSCHQVVGWRHNSHSACNSHPPSPCFRQPWRSTMVGMSRLSTNVTVITDWEIVTRGRMRERGRERNRQ